MAKYPRAADLNALFSALADPTRRAVITRLGRGPASVSELAAPLSISLPSVTKHVRSLEACGLISTRKSGRIRMCSLNRSRMTLLDAWLDEQRRVWESATDRLEAFVTTDRSRQEEL